MQSVEIKAIDNNDFVARYVPDQLTHWGHVLRTTGLQSQ
jgi:hypothetical protein